MGRGLLIVSLALAVIARGQDNGPDPSNPSDPPPAVADSGVIPVKVVGGRLVAHVELSTIHRRIPANLFIEFDNPCGLRLHNGAAGAIKAENKAGETTPVSVHFPDFVITVESREHGPEQEYKEFTRLYSREIDEDSLVGAIGAKVLGNYVVTFDLANGELILEPPAEPREADEQPESNSESGEKNKDIEVSITTTDDIVWLPVQLEDGKVQAMAVSTSNYDTLVDQEWCDDLGHPAGDIGAVRMGALNFSEFVALRPAEVNYVHPDGAIAVAGLNLLEHLKLTIDRQNRIARCRISVPPEFPAADRALFQALVNEDAEALETWLGKHPRQRLSQEAARLLLGYRIDEDAEPEQFQKAIAWLAGTWREDIVSTRTLDLMRELQASGYPMMAVHAGELGIEGGREDRYPNSVHSVHASMGEILLDHDDDQRAWRHLLSAAFGLPEDGMINLKLGQFYEKQKRYNRALSRYVQAVITIEAGEKAVEGLERVQKLTGDGEGLSVDTIAPLIAGKTYNYTAATRYRPKEGEETNRVALVEFFTNTHIKHPSKDEGAIGGALGNEGVMTYFPRTKVAMLAYHLPHPRFEMDSLTNEFAQHMADRVGAGPAAQIVNGGEDQFAGYGHVRDAETIYKAGRAAVLAALNESSPFQLRLQCAVNDGKIAGQLVVEGPETSATVQIVLAERGVLYPGKSKVVIQRMVARASLTKNLGGQPFNPKSGKMTLSFSRSLENITQANIDYLEELQATGAGSVQTFAAKMDPRQLSVVAIVRDHNGKVLQAAQVDARQPNQEAKS